MMQSNTGRGACLVKSINSVPDKNVAASIPRVFSSRFVARATDTSSSTMATRGIFQNLSLEINWPDQAAHSRHGGKNKNAPLRARCFRRECCPDGAHLWCGRSQVRGPFLLFSSCKKRRKASPQLLSECPGPNPAPIHILCHPMYRPT